MTRSEYALLGITIGYGLGRALEDWPGSIWASLFGFLLALATVWVIVRSERRQYHARMSQKAEEG